MAVQRDTSYTPFAPVDTRELLDKLRAQGHVIPNPVWTVGRLDERTPTEDEDGERQEVGDEDEE